MNEEEQKNLPEPEVVRAKGHTFLVLLILSVIIVVVVFSIRGCALTEANPDNTDGKTSITRRSANIYDVSIDSELDLSSMGAKYTVNPKVDIDGLEITMTFLDKNKAILTTVAKTLGNVKEGIQINFTISLFDLGLTVAWNVAFESATVTGGTVSNFAF